MAMTPAEFVEAKGAPIIAEKIGVDVGAIRLWKHRNRIPRGNWPELIKAFDDVSLDGLLEIEAAGRPETADTQDAA